MLSNRKTFWAGVLLSPLVIAFLWALSHKPGVNTPEQKQKSLSLLSIDFIPSETRPQVSDKKFLKLSVDENAAEQQVSLLDFKGKPVIVHFWATWCGSCVEEMPELDRFSEKYGENVHLVVVAADKTRGKEAREFYQAKGIKNLSIYVDEKNALAISLKVTALPTTIFVSSNGKEMGRILGPIDWIGEAGQLINTHLSKRK